MREQNKAPPNCSADIVVAKVGLHHSQVSRRIWNYAYLRPTDFNIGRRKIVFIAFMAFKALFF
jgi:hypothetical protein